MENDWIKLEGASRMVMKDPTLGVLFVDGGEESRTLLSRLGDISGKIRIVDVSKNGLRGWLLMEYGTTEVPLLVTENSILSGVKNIMEFLEKLAR
ncbi:hypothetical protein [Infirmifilum uzonense]|nr:hypothetical protein [Infirmifilum uzonense]